ncbi:hypothetical protein TNCV_3139501 [Trichonephila clavipes]|nr:hypothetical protein TNCV_3139501 [Trichonephila clavipes]
MKIIIKYWFASIESLRSTGITSVLRVTSRELTFVLVKIRWDYIVFNRERGEMPTSSLILHNLISFSYHATPTTNHLKRHAFFNVRGVHALIDGGYTSPMRAFVSDNSTHFHW